MHAVLWFAFPHIISESFPRKCAQHYLLLFSVLRWISTIIYSTVPLSVSTAGRTSVPMSYPCAQGGLWITSVTMQALSRASAHLKFGEEGSGVGRVLQEADVTWCQNCEQCGGLGACERHGAGQRVWGDLSADPPDLPGRRADPDRASRSLGGRGPPWGVVPLGQKG